MELRSGLTRTGRSTTKSRSSSTASSARSWSIRNRTSRARPTSLTFTNPAPQGAQPKGVSRMASVLARLRVLIAVLFNRPLKVRLRSDHKAIFWPGDNLVLPAMAGGAPEEDEEDDKEKDKDKEDDDSDSDEEDDEDSDDD